MCVFALERDFVFKNVYQSIRIVPNPDYETTLKNLKKKMSILKALK